MSDSAVRSHRADVSVIGGTPAGVAAVIAAAREGLHVVLVEPSQHLGGLMTSGLGATDIRPSETVGGLFRRFVSSVHRHYVETYGPDSEQVRDSRAGYRFEPSVAERLLEELIAGQPNLEVWRGWRLAWQGGPSLREGGRWLVESAPGADPASPDGTAERRVTAVVLDALDERGRPTAKRLRLEARVIIDATYEGDVALGAGASYRVGREGREEFGESHAGVIYQDFHDRLVYPGSTGAPDRRVQAYNYRLCLTKDPANRLPIERPAGYDRARYASLVDDVRTGRMPGCDAPRGGTAVLNIVPMPNGKSDANNHHFSFVSSNWPEENFDYPEAGPDRRAQIAAAHRAYTEGLVWFCQHDTELPEEFRNAAREWGLAADELQESGGFPRQLYIREACRIRGGYLFDARDALLDPSGGRAPVHWDSVAAGGYQIDSHATHKREDLGLPPSRDGDPPEGRRLALEGFIGLAKEAVPYQIPYRVMLPEGIDDLIVPVAVSATHLGYGTIRMEPVWMALGEAAGAAAALAIKRGVRDVPRGALQRSLLAYGQVITFFEDIAPRGFPGSEHQPPELSAAAQFWGTLGFFQNYAARPDGPLSLGEARRWAWLVRRAVDPWRPIDVDASPSFPEADAATRPWVLIASVPDSAWFDDGADTTWFQFNEIVRRQMSEASPLRASLGVPLDPPELGDPHRVVTRGEACRLLFRLYAELV